MTLPKITLFLVGSVRETCSWFFINWKKVELEDIRIFINEDGYGIEHEFVEMDLLITILRTEPKVAEYDWETCRIHFHEITDSVLDD